MRFGAPDVKHDELTGLESGANVDQREILEPRRAMLCQSDDGFCTAIVPHSVRRRFKDQEALIRWLDQTRILLTRIDLLRSRRLCSQ